MANTFLTPSIIAQEALMQLENNMVFGNMVNKSYSSEFRHVGDTITVRKPVTFRVDEFAGDINVQNINETGVPVKMDKLLDISFPIDTRDLTLTIENFSERYITPAMSAFAQDIDSRLAKLALDVPYFAGEAGTTPNSVSAITSVRKVMNDNKVPMAGRSLVLDTAADAKLLELDAFNRVDASGTSDAIVNAQLGRKFGFDCYMDQNVATVANSDLVSTAPKLAVAADDGDTTITITDSALSGTIHKGTLFTVAGSTQKFVVTKDATAVSNAVTVEVYPAVTGGIKQDAAITLVGDHTANIAFHKNAFSLVSVPLAKPMGSANCANVSYRGLGLRVTYGYDQSKKQDIISIDGLFGFKTLTPELACVLLG